MAAALWEPFTLRMVGTEWGKGTFLHTQRNMYPVDTGRHCTGPPTFELLFMRMKPDLLIVKQILLWSALRAAQRLDEIPLCVVSSLWSARPSLTVLRANTYLSSLARPT